MHRAAVIGHKLTVNAVSKVTTPKIRIIDSKMRGSRRLFVGWAAEPFPLDCFWVPGPFLLSERARCPGFAKLTRDYHHVHLPTPTSNDQRLTTRSDPLSTIH